MSGKESGKANRTEKNWEMMLAALKKFLEQPNAQAQQPTPKPNPALKRLDAFVGEWAFESPQYPGARGQAVFEWLEGGAFLVQHSGVEPAQLPPAAMMIIGRDESAETYCMLYFDSRGVSRVYQMSLNDGVWKIWKEAPGFSQRFIGSFSDDSRTIRGRWEKSGDGANWEHDFDLTYTKVR